jgi:hypothetical protein
MPYDVKERRRAGALNRGARVILDDMPDQVLYVQSALHKTKYTYLVLGLTLDGDVIERLQYEHDVEVTTVHEKLTKEEQLKRDLRRAKSWASAELYDGLNRVPADVLTRLAQAWHEGPYKGHVLDWSESAKFFQIQAQYRVWKTIEKTLRRLREMYGEDVTPLSAIVVEFHEYELERTQRSVPDPTSRSTSVMSNFIEDLDRWAWEKLIDNARYHVGPDVHAYELARLQELADARKAAEAEIDATS